MRRPSLSEFADQFELAIKEKDEISSRLHKALGEISALTQLYQQAGKEFESERSLLKSEISQLRAQIAELSEKKSKPQNEGAGANSLLAAQEKLIRAEFERKFQELAGEVRRQRKTYTQQVEKMKEQLSNCICRASG